MQSVKAVQQAYSSCGRQLRACVRHHKGWVQGWCQTTALLLTCHPKAMKTASHATQKGNRLLDTALLCMGLMQDIMAQRWCRDQAPTACHIAGTNRPALQAQGVLVHVQHLVIQHSSN